MSLKSPAKITSPARFAAWGFFVFRLCAMCAASIRAPLVAMPRALSRFAGLLDKLLGPVPKAAAPATYHLPIICGTRTQARGVSRAVSPTAGQSCNRRRHRQAHRQAGQINPASSLWRDMEGKHADTLNPPHQRREAAPHHHRVRRHGRMQELRCWVSSWANGLRVLQDGGAMAC